MNSKKVNIFAVIMIVVMCAFSIFIGLYNNDGKDGNDGKSAYQLAIESGEFSGTQSEYLASLYGKDGSSITLDDIYNAYLSENNLSKDDCTYSDFLLNYFPDQFLPDDDAVTKTEITTQIALRSTVDICYSYCIDQPIVYVQENGNKLYIDESKNYASIGVSAGSGVIYKMSDDTCYIITNYHVLYAANYTNDSSYRVFYNSTTDTYFTAKYENVKIEGSFFGSQKYINKSSINYAPIHTHFLDSYGVYLYGYQSEEYKLSASFVGGSADNDIAVLKIEKNETPNNALIFNGSYSAASIGDSSNLNEGETIIAVGNPLLADTNSVDDSNINAEDYVNLLEKTYIDALCLTSTDGVVSNISEYCTFESIIDSSKAISLRLIRVSAAINAGNSGGSLFDLNGRLVGVVNGKIESSSYDNVGYAIPVNIATRLADQIIEQCDGSKTQTRIKAITTNSLGITVKNGNRNSQFVDFEWVLGGNVVVDKLSATGVGFGIGLKVGDIIESVEIGTTTYSLNHDYELDDLLLLVSPNKNQTIKFNVLTTDNNVLTSKTYTVNPNSAMFTEIA